jgi:predicted ATPase
MEILRLKKMLSKLRVQHYKSLFNTEIDLEPLTVFIGPNGSGKSNICESLAVLADLLQRFVYIGSVEFHVKETFVQSIKKVSQYSQNLESKFWHGELNYLVLEAETNGIDSNSPDNKNNIRDISIVLDYNRQTVELSKVANRLKLNIGLNKEKEQEYDHTLRQFLISNNYPNSSLANSLKKVRIYDFSPIALCGNAKSTLLIKNNDNLITSSMDRTGQGISYALADILLADRERFNELEERLTRLVPNIKRISLLRTQDQEFSLELIDRYSEHHIPASDISDGTLRILGFLTALYQENTPSIICFEEIENGIHPWLLHKMVELLKIVSTEGITGNPVQVLITTHSPVLLNYVEPHQVRAVELDGEGKTQVHNLPVDSVRFQKALEAYDGDLGELWFTNVFGGNPE